MFALARQFLAHVLPGVVKPLRVLWNEVIGFVFVVFAIVAGFSAYRNLSNDANPDNFGRGLIAAAFGGIMLAFGLHSFLRARRIGRS